MNPFVGPIAFIGLVYGSIVYLNERHGLLSCDRFRSAAARYGAYAWLGFFMLALVVLVVGSALQPPTAKQLESAPFYSLFALHAVLIVFLVGWWLLTERPPLRQFLNIPREGTAEAVLLGIAVGFGGWIVTILGALTVALILRETGVMAEDPKPSPMIGWMASLPLWKKGLIVLSAMTVEEAFFRGFLQKRVGVIASTILFALAHAGLGQPLLLIGVSVISLVIGLTFYRTKNLIPGIVAHGVFDAVQLFVIIPIAFKFVGQ